MQDIKFKISNTEAANIEIVPVNDGVEIIVHYGSHQQQSAQNYGSNQKEPSESPKKAFKFHGKQSSPEDIIEGMKEVARKLYSKEGTDKEELKKFVKFYENLITEKGEWKGGFDFDRLWEKWLSNKR